VAARTSRPHHWNPRNHYSHERAEPDTDGYVVTVDDEAQIAIGTDATLLRENVEPGEQSVRLAGVASNCAAGREGDGCHPPIRIP